MAYRSILHVNKLQAFEEYLVKNGWEIQELKGNYEVLRATKQGRKYPLIVYRREENNTGTKTLVHLSVFDRDIAIIREFIKDCKKNKKGEK